MDLTKIRTVRRMKKMTIKTVASRTGLSRDRISLIERGKVNPSFDSVVIILKAMDAELTVSI